MCTVEISYDRHGRTLGPTHSSDEHKPHEYVQLRWDHADLASNYRYTGEQLEPILSYLTELSCRYDQNDHQIDYKYVIDRIYDDVVNTMVLGANQFVPHCHKKFFKFWWDEEMDLLKEASIESNLIWKAAGKPKHGPIFSNTPTILKSARLPLTENRPMFRFTCCLPNEIRFN